MEIKFSRHAKRRARLYNIPESTVSGLLADMDLRQGEGEIVRRVAGFQYPLKIVISVEEDVVTVLTIYPLKKGRGK